MAEYVSNLATATAEPEVPDGPTPEERARQRDEGLLRLAKQRWQFAEEREHDLRMAMLDDMKFSIGEDQWDPEIRRQREAAKRLCLTVNRMQGFITQVTNAQRQQRPAIKVRPVDDAADVQTAQILQGLIRHIEQDSNADVAYDTAHDNAVRCGRGYFRILTAYESAFSFDQVIKIQRIRNPFTVQMDPTHQQPDGSDAAWGFVAETISRDRFCELYEIEPTEWDQWTSLGDDDWSTKDEARVAEYFYRDTVSALLAQLQTGEVRLLGMEQADDGDELTQAALEGVMARYQIQPIAEQEVPLITAQRRTQIPLLWWCKLCGWKVLERQWWPGKYIPIVPMLGDEVDINGTVHLSGIPRHAKDSQRRYNFMVTLETEAIGTVPKSPWLGTVKQFEGHMQEFQRQNIALQAVLTYEPDIRIVAGAPVPMPPPSRISQEPAIQAISLAMAQASDDLKATTSIFDAALGDRSNETSGVGIRQRQQQSQQANFHYSDNKVRALRQCGQILIDLIPVVYNRQKVARIVGEDGQAKRVLVAPGAQQQTTPVQGMPGIEGIYDLSVGTYDVTVDVGPNYETRRQENVDTMLKLTQTIPQVGNVGADLLVRDMDVGYAQELSKRLEKTLAPGMIEGNSGKPEEQVAALAQQVQQLEQHRKALDAFGKQAQQQIEALTQENAKLHAQHDVHQSEVVIKQLELELKRFEIATKHQEAQLKAQVDQIRAQAEIEKARLSVREARIEARDAGE